MMKEKIGNRLFEIKQIVNYFCSKNFGETVKYKELQKLTHYNLDDEFESSKFKQNIIVAVKNELIEKGYIIQSIRKVGYYILKPNQIQSYTYRNYIKRPLKKYEKAQKILINTKKDELVEEELEKHKLTEKLNYELINRTEEIINDKRYLKINE